jgi:hypothetical protein
MRRRGRPIGAVIPLVKDSGRFELAFALAWEGLGLDKYPAARLAMAIFSPTPFTTQSIGDLVVASVVMPKFRTIEGHTNRTVRKISQKMYGSLEDRRWLKSSAEYLGAFIVAQRNGWSDVSRICLFVLEQQLGWGPTIRCIGTRLDAASRSNLPPFDGSLGRNGLALVARWQGKL